MNSLKLIYSIIIMAAVTYIIRLIPLTFFRKKIKNPYIKSFLNFVPFSVLGAMTFPGVFSSTGSYISAVIGVITALVLSLKGKGLLLVSLVSCAVVFIVDLGLSLI